MFKGVKLIKNHQSYRLKENIQCIHDIDYPVDIYTYIYNWFIYIYRCYIYIYRYYIYIYYYYIYI